MPKKLISVDLTKAPWEQETPLHNRWHPDIPPVAKVAQGEKFRVECIDWTGGQIKNNDCSDDVKSVDLLQVHYLSGPVEVDGAEPGDLLKVKLLELGPLDGDEWGFTGTFAKENGGGKLYFFETTIASSYSPYSNPFLRIVFAPHAGFLTDHFPKATKACWDIDGIYCTSRHIPGVKFPGLIHPGLIGTAPR
jgi:formamidase